MMLFMSTILLLLNLICRCTQHIANPATKTAAVYIGASGQLNSSVASFDRSTLLRTVVTCQQMLATLLESAQLEPTANRSLTDMLTEEFERLRRYVTLLDMPSAELLVSVCSCVWCNTYMCIV